MNTDSRKYLLLIVSLICLFFAVYAASANAQALSVELKPVGLSEQDAQILIRRVLNEAPVKDRLSGKRYRVIASAFDSGDEEKVGLERASPQYLIHVYDYTDDALMHIYGPSDMSRAPAVHFSAENFPASNEEFEEAVAILKKSREFGRLLRGGAWKIYEPMPSTLQLPSTGRQRIVAVGLRPRRAGVIHEIVGVNLSRPGVVRFTGHAPPSSRADERSCGFPDAGQFNTIRGTPGSAEITIRDGDKVLWNFTVKRPSFSTGFYGSGLEIKKLYYKDRLVLGRAHAPIVNVKYEGDYCGPFRDWAAAESAFRADGENTALGIRITKTRPSTIADSKSDYGNFRGVAIYPEKNKVTLVTELAAGWYRYVNEFRLYKNGTIEPRWYFTGVEDSCVCHNHYHNVYWRLDFDIDGSEPNIVEASPDGVSWRRIEKEASQRKSYANRYWRVRNSNTGTGYEIIPGPYDGRADAYSKSDLWLLKYHALWEYDDFFVKNSTEAALNAFVDDESLDSDVVLWYAVHFSHLDGSEHVRGLGPTLRPLSW